MISSISLVHGKYTTTLSGKLCMISFHIACIRCVLPSPTLPYKNRGLYVSHGFSATALAAEKAKLLLDQTIKLSNLKLGSNSIHRYSPKSFFTFSCIVAEL
jgi:hypothetical protein